MQRIMRSILVAFLVAMLSFSPATACHYCGGYGGGSYYAPGGSYGGGCGGYYTSGCGGCGGEYYESACCGNEVVVSDGCGDCGNCGDCGCNDCATGYVEEGYAQEPVPGGEGHVDMMAPEEPLHSEPMPSTVNRPAQEAPALPPSTPATESAPLPTYSEPATPVTPPVVESEPLTPPATNAANEPAPLPTEPTAPGAEPTDDLFGEPMNVPTSEPAAAPATEPAAAPATEPATPPADDLFSEPATDPAALPAEEPATPAEADDFFSEPAAEPATEAATETAPATEPAAEPAAEPSDDDLFAPPAEETPAEEKPAEETTEESDDLFGAAEAILEQPGGLASSELREWVDNTGKHTCRGRMIRMLDGKVQLVKDSGRTTTVPLARLSKNDLEFVNRQASAQKAESLGKTAKVANAW